MFPTPSQYTSITFLPITTPNNFSHPMFRGGGGRHVIDPLTCTFPLQRGDGLQNVPPPATSSFHIQLETIPRIQLPLMSSFPVPSNSSSPSTVPPPEHSLYSSISFISFDSTLPPAAPCAATHVLPPPSSLAPLGRHCYSEPNEVLTFSCMDFVCSVCLALHWLDECNNDSTSSPTFGRCCHHGKVLLHPLPDPPLPLCDLFTADCPRSTDFHHHIRQYNCTFAFTSFRANEQLINVCGGGPWVFKTGYMLYHSSSCLLPPSTEQARYAQLYFYDADLALDQQMHHNSNLHRNMMQILQDTLLCTNKYTHVFLHASEIL
jgi:hypothetical protein